MKYTQCEFQKQDDNITYICTRCNIPWIDKNNIGFAPPRNCSNITEEEREDRKANIIPKTEQPFPSLKQRISTYRNSREHWVQQGKPIRSQERINEIYDNYCDKCKHKTNYCCGICGCFVNKNKIFNKIAWSTTRCPLEEIGEEPKWIEEPEFTHLNRPQIMLEPPKVNPTAQTGIIAPTNDCGCGK